MSVATGGRHGIWTVICAGYDSDSARGLAPPGRDQCLHVAGAPPAEFRPQNRLPVGITRRRAPLAPNLISAGGAGAGFVVELEKFSGPLDLLLHLIREAEADTTTLPTPKPAPQSPSSITTPRLT